MITVGRCLVVPLLVLQLVACSPRALIVQGVVSELASQGQAPEEDLILAREASAFYLKLLESLLRETPGHGPLAEAVAAGFTQYAYAFVQFDAERLDVNDAKAAQKLRERAARLYRRAQRHALNTFEQQTPGFTKSLASDKPADWPKLRADQIGLAYWAAASWGGLIALSKDDPDIVADLPLAIRLAQLAWHTAPDYGAGALASLMGSFEMTRPGGSQQQALAYFDEAINLGAGQNAGAFVAKAEGIALRAGDRAGFESLLKQALLASESHPSMQNGVMRERALWLLETAADLF